MELTRPETERLVVVALDMVVPSKVTVPVAVRLNVWMPPSA